MNWMIIDLTPLMMLLSLPMQTFLTRQLTTDIAIEPFTQNSGPYLPENFDVSVATALDYFNPLFKPEKFSDMKDQTNNCHLQTRRNPEKQK